LVLRTGFYGHSVNERAFRSKNWKEKHGRYYQVEETKSPNQGQTNQNQADNKASAEPSGYARQERSWGSIGIVGRGNSRFLRRSETDPRRNRRTVSS